MAKRYYAAILTYRASAKSTNVPGFGRYDETATCLYGLRGSRRKKGKLFIWHIGALNGPKGVYAFRRKLDESGLEVLTGPMSELSGIVFTPKGSKKTPTQKPRGSQAKRGAKRRALSTHKAIKSRQFQVGKNLTKKEALKKALRRSRRDHRGFTYNPKTGVAVLT